MPSDLEKMQDAKALLTEVRQNHRGKHPVVDLDLAEAQERVDDAIERLEELESDALHADGGEA